jgi:hypothetical protein
MQLSDEINIRRWKLIIPEVIWRYPSQISDIERYGVSLQDHAVEKVEANRFRRVVIVNGEKFVIHTDFYPEFFLDFAPQRDLKGLAWFHLSTWKFPQPREMYVVEPLGD